MENKGMKVFTTEEIFEYLSNDRVKKDDKMKFQREGFRCWGSFERPTMGLSRLAKIVPKSIHILISPVACQRHCDLDLTFSGYNKDVYSLFLTEQEIVTGKVVDVLRKEIYELLKTLTLLPKVITLTTTCVDALIHTDYDQIKKWLKEEYGIRFGRVEMNPILADNKVNHFDRFPYMVYELIETDIQKPKKKLINLIGKVDPADENSEFYRLLKDAGYEVHEIRQCRTLAEFDEMGEACLNVVLSGFHIHAAKMMEKKYGIPYFFWNQHMTFEKIKANYMGLEKILGCVLDISEYYIEARNITEEVRQMAEGRTFVVGQEVDFIPVKAACDLVSIGIDVKYIMTDKIEKKDLVYYEYLRDNSPDTKIYLAPDISMRRFIANPEEADYVIGGSCLFKNMKGKMIRLPEEPYDFKGYICVMQKMKEAFQDNSLNKQINILEDDIFKREWRIFPRDEV